MADSTPTQAKSGKLGTVLFVLIALGYLGFEIYVVSRNSYRAEPDYIFRSYVEASEAMGTCGGLKVGPTEAFESNFRYVRRRAIESIAESGQGQHAADADVAVREMEQQKRKEVDDLISRTDCDEKKVWMLRKRYENYSRQNLPGA